MPSIADLYSTIDSYKRRATDVLSDPQNSLMQMLGYANDRARNYNESLAQASKERGYGPKTQELAQAMAEAYNPVGMTTWHGSPHTLGSKFEYPREQAFKIAQENAALPVSEGGLGLPKDNTPEMRAKAMGYETPMYHGTNEDIEVFNTKGKGKTAGAGAFFTTNPTTAETYVSSSGGGNILPVMVKKNDLLNVNARGKNWSDIYTNQLGAKSGKIKYSPEELGLDLNSATTTDELGMIAADLGKKGIEIKNVKDLGPNSHVMRAKEYLLNKYGIVPDEIWSNVTGKQFDESQKAMKKFYESQKSDIVALQDPSMIRSKFAAFDPKQMGNPDLLAGVLPLSLGGATLVGANNDDVHSPNYLENLHKQLAQKPIDVTDVHAPNYLEDIHNQLANQQ